MSAGRKTVSSRDLEQILQGLRSDILKGVDTKLESNKDKMVSVLEDKERKTRNGFMETPAKESGLPKKLPTKEFAFRNSALTDLLENPDMRSVCNCVFAVLVLMYFYIAIFYSFNVERFKEDLSVVCWGFGQFNLVAATWLGINVSIVFLLYPVFRFWATNRTFLKKKGLYDSMFCTLFILYEAALCIIPAKAILAYNAPPVSSAIIVAEQIRLFMKSYAFVRENIPRALKFKLHQDGDKEDEELYPCPEVGKLIYFLFAPTLVYRDNYPRTTHIRWNYVSLCFLQVIYGVLTSYIVFVWFAVNTCRRAGIEPISFEDLIGALIQSILAGGLLMFTTNFGILHTLQEIFGEILRFGDRRFFDDWWNSTSYATFLRSWNLLVKDWLYCYIYRDTCVVLGRTGATLTVLMISELVHEYILAVVCKFLFPLFFFEFVGLGVPLVFITRKQTSRFWNVFLFFSLFQGCGFMLVFYTLEWYARINCPKIIDSWQDYLIPRSFYYNVISWPS